MSRHLSHGGSGKGRISEPWFRFARQGARCIETVVRTTDLNFSRRGEVKIPSPSAVRYRKIARALEDERRAQIYLGDRLSARRLLKPLAGERFFLGLPSELATPLAVLPVP